MLVLVLFLALGSLVTVNGFLLMVLMVLLRWFFFFFFSNFITCHLKQISIPSSYFFI